MTDATHADAWREYRRRRLLFWLVFLSGFSMIFVAVGYSKLTGHRVNWSLFYGWMVVHAFNHFRLFLWKCPRCSRPFHAKSLFGNGLADRCMHCGLPKWAEEPESER